MSSELPNQFGDEGEDRLIALLKQFNWILRGEPNLTLTTDSSVNPDRKSNDYGIDAYMTYNGPYRNKERGIIVESKNPTWHNYRPSDLEDYHDNTLDKVVAAPQAKNFDDIANFDTERIINAGLLGIWFRQEEDEPGFNPDTFQEHIENRLEAKPKRRKPYQILILTNKQLNKLSSLQSKYLELKQEYGEDLQLFYPSRSDSNSEKSDLLTIEYMLSNYVFVTLNDTREVHGEEVTVDVNIVFYFDEISKEGLDFMYRSLLEYTFDNADELWIYAYTDIENEQERIQSQSIFQEFEQNGIHSKLSGEAPKIDVKRLQKERYDEYADNLIDERVI